MVAISELVEDYQKLRWNSRESIATSCTVVMGPSSGTLAFLLLIRFCSFTFDLIAKARSGRSTIPLLGCPTGRDFSDSGLFRPG